LKVQRCKNAKIEDRNEIQSHLMGDTKGEYMRQRSNLVCPEFWVHTKEASAITTKKSELKT
jgi:hypothetical protein